MLATSLERDPDRLGLTDAHVGTSDARDLLVACAIYFWWWLAVNDGNGVAWRGLEQELALLDDPKRASLSRMITLALNYADEIGANCTKLELSTVLGAFPEMVAARGAEEINTFLENQADGGPAS